MTQIVACNDAALASFNVSTDIGVPGAGVVGTPTDDGRNNATVNAEKTIISYDPDNTGKNEKNECGKTVTINYQFSYLENGQPFTDGTGVLKVIVKAAHSPAVAPLQTIDIACTHQAKAEVDLGPVLTGNGWLNPNVTVTKTSKGKNDATVSNNVVTYEVDGQDTKNDCGKTVVITYDFDYTEDGVRYTDGTGRIEVKVGA